MRYRTKRLIRKNAEFVGLMLLGPVGGEIHANRWPGEATFSNRVDWPGFLGPKPVAKYDAKHGRRRP